MKKKNRAVNTGNVPKKLNPFEVHVNRQKHVIVGKKSKADKGLPGIARSKAIKKRKATLLLEFNSKDKQNKFMDRRIGERNFAMTAADKTLARFTAERMRSHSKNSVFNLGDDEVLTHRGQSLSEIEKFDDPKSEDEDDDEDGINTDGKLDSKFVGEAHFGGGMLKKVDGESKSRKDLIDQLIAESKKRKFEKQKMREETSSLTQKLDAEWKELLPLVTAAKKKKGEEEEEDEKDKKKDRKSLSYDVISKQLRFESKGKPSDKLKSADEVAKEEKERLEQLEKDRIERMLGDQGNAKQWKHKSADDLDDGFELETEDVMIQYDSEGKLINPEHFTSEEMAEQSGDEVDEDIKTQSGDEESIGDDSQDNGSETNVVMEEAEDGAEEKEEDDDDDDTDDNLSEFKDSESDSDVEPEAANSAKLSKDVSASESVRSLREMTEAMQRESAQKAECMEKARRELPFTFDIPEEYEELEQVLSKYNADYQGVVVERMIKCSHPSLKSANKEKLEKLFMFLLQHLQDSATDDATQMEVFKVLDRMAPWLYDLTQWSPAASANGVREVLREKHSDFMKRPSKYPGIDTLIFLKLVSILFPTSDYRHEVATPALLFIQHMLASCKVRNSVDLTTGLFLTTLVLEYTAYAKRFVPEAINFVLGVMQLTVAPTQQSQHGHVEPCFRSCPLTLAVTHLTQSCPAGSLKVDHLIRSTDTDEFRIHTTALALDLLSQFCTFWSDEPAAYLIFEPFLLYLKPNQHCTCLRSQVQQTADKISKFRHTKLEKLVLERKKPKPLKLYEPCIEQVYCFKKRPTVSKEKQEHEKLVYKYKKEMKGALREIRRDRTFLAKLKLKQTQHSDMERKRKVKEIFGACADQAGELKKLKRKKNR